MMMQGGSSTSESVSSYNNNNKWTNKSKAKVIGAFPWVTTLYCIGFTLVIGRNISHSKNETLRQLHAVKHENFAAKTTLARKSTHAYIPDKYFTSQHDEDRKLLEWFATLSDGTYLEVGAQDGVTYSNTFMFNKVLGWKGVLIELVEANYNKMLRSRPDEIALINAGVCSSVKNLHYYNNPQNRLGNGAVGGIYEFAKPSFREQWWGGTNLDDPRVQEFQCSRLNNLLLEHAPATTYFDFFSLDVVGGEVSALQTIDFDRVGFGIILIAADEQNGVALGEMMKLLKSKGYVFLYQYEQNYWFEHGDFRDIYRDLIYYLSQRVKESIVP